MIFRSFKGFPLELWIVFVAILINRLGTMGLPFLLLFLIEKRGFLPTTASIIFSLYPISAIVVGPIVGRLSDRLSPIIVMQISLIASGVAVAMVPFVSNVIALGMCVIFWAVLSEGFRPANYAFITGLAGEGQQKRFLSMSRLAVNLGMSIGPAVGGLLTKFSFLAIFVFDGLTAVLAGIVLLTYSGVLEKGKGLPKNLTSTGVEYPTALRNQSMLPVVLAILLPAEIVFFQQQSVFPLFVTGPLKMSPFVYGLAFTLNTILIILFEVPLNTRLAAVPSSRTSAIGSVLIGLGFGSLAFVKSAGFLVVSVILWTFGEMLFLPGSAAYIAEMAPPSRRGTYMGFYQMGLSIAFAFGAIIGVRLASGLGYRLFWQATLVMAVVSAIGLTVRSKVARTACANTI